jgi:hypothetical protein
LKRTQILFAIAIFSFGAGAVWADENEDRCNELNQGIKQQLQASVQARVPQEDPSTYVQNGYDVKGLMMQDTSSGLSKLMGLNFTGILQSLVNGAMQQTMARGQQNFSSNMNSVLGSFGIPAMQFQRALASSVPSLPSATLSNLVSNSTSALTNLFSTTPTPAPAPVQKTWSPYGDIP